MFKTNGPRFKRKRDPTFVPSEKMLLLDLVQKYYNILECKKTDSLSIRIKHQHWLKIAREFNSVSSIHKREWLVLKNCWENLKKKAKQQDPLKIQHDLGTDGPKQIDDEAMKRTLDMIKDGVPMLSIKKTHILPSEIEQTIEKCAYRLKPVLKDDPEELVNLTKTDKKDEHEHEVQWRILLLQEEREKELLEQEKLKTLQEQVKLELLQLELKKSKG